MSEKKRRLNTLSLSNKAKLIREIDKGIKKKVEIAADFGISPSSLSTIIKNRENILKVADNCSINHRKRLKPCTYEDIDEATLEWVKQAHCNNDPISGPIIREKALSFAKSLGHFDFVASFGWLDKFKKRHNIVQNIIGRGDSEHECNEWRNKLLPELILQYQEEEVFSAKEMTLFFNCLLNSDENSTSFISKKMKISVILGVNMCGKEKLKPLVVGECSSSCESILPVIYRSNDKAQTTSELYEEWILKLDEKFSSENRKVLLFLDKNLTLAKTNFNCISIAFLPKKMQPMSQGIINCVKVNYKNRILKDSCHMEAVTLNNVISNLIDAWDFDIDQKAIKNCFEESGFIKPEKNLNCTVPDVYCKNIKIETHEPLEENISANEKQFDEDYAEEERTPYKVKICDEENLRSDDEEISVPSDLQMRNILNQCTEYLYSKDNVPDEVCLALTTLQTFVENEISSDKKQ